MSSTCRGRPALPPLRGLHTQPGELPAAARRRRGLQGDAQSDVLRLHSLSLLMASGTASPSSSPSGTRVSSPGPWGPRCAPCSGCSFLLSWLAFLFWCSVCLLKNWTASPQPPSPTSSSRGPHARDDPAQPHPLPLALPHRLVLPLLAGNAPVQGKSVQPLNPPLLGREQQRRLDHLLSGGPAGEPGPRGAPGAVLCQVLPKGPELEAGKHLQHQPGGGLRAAAPRSPACLAGCCPGSPTTAQFASHPVGVPFLPARTPPPDVMFEISQATPLGRGRGIFQFGEDLRG